MDHTEIERRCDDIVFAMQAKGYPEAYVTLSFLGHVGNQWECSAATTTKTGSQRFGDTRWHGAPEAALSATLAEVSSDALRACPRKWTDAEVAATLGIAPAEAA